MGAPLLAWAIMKTTKTVLSLSLAVLAVAIAYADAPAPLTLTYNVTPNGSGSPGEKVILSMDVRRNPNLNQEDIFYRQVFPGTYPRTAGQQFQVMIPDVKGNDTIIVQGYMCSETTGDCYPSDKDNPPSCSVTINIQGNRPSCQPYFTWTGGDKSGGVVCHTECR